MQLLITCKKKKMKNKVKEKKREPISLTDACIDVKIEVLKKVLGCWVVHKADTSSRMEIKQSTILRCKYLMLFDASPTMHLTQRGYLEFALNAKTPETITELKMGKSNSMG